MKNVRKYSYDILRILAAFSVVMLHSAAQFWYDLDVKSSEWIIANSYDSVFRFGVPVFVMLSGAIFLDWEYKLDVKRLYLHNILRLMLLYIVWSCAYGLLDCTRFGVGTLQLPDVIREMLNGRYHLWYLPMIVGIYMLLPILQSWIKNAEQKNIEYFLLLFFLLQIGRQTIRAVTKRDEISFILNLADVDMVCGYIGYFVWGYYLIHIGISAKLRKILYIMFVPSVLLNVVLGNLLAWKAGAPVAEIYDSFGLFTFIMVTVMFDFITSKGKCLSFGTGSGKLLKEISTDTLGVYLMHLGVMEILQSKGIHSMSLPNVVGIPLYAVGCFLICLVIAGLLRRIPVIGRYLC